jgi:hypothetical protein
MASTLGQSRAFRATVLFAAATFWFAPRPADWSLYENVRCRKPKL